MKYVYLFAAITGMALAIACSDSSPTSPAVTPPSSMASEATTATAGEPGRNSSPWSASNPVSSVAASHVDEEFNCENVSEVYVRFSDPGYVNQNAVGLYASFDGMPPGRKIVRIWWDFEGAPEKYQDVHIEEGEVQRDNDLLFDYKDVIEHVYQGIVRPTTYRVRLEMILVDKTGNCARVREVTVTPGVVKPGSGSGSGELVINGTFETGDTTGWTRTSVNGQLFGAFQGGVNFNCCPMVTPAPFEGTWLAASEQPSGPSTQSMYQDITIPAGSTATLSFQWGTAYAFGGGAPDQVRVDIANPATNVPNTGGSGSLLNIVATNGGVGAVPVWQSSVTDLSAFAGQTIRLIIWATANTSPTSIYIDDISLTYVY